ncbi:MAG: response regulator [Geminicoccaceae bacterium]
MSPAGRVARVLMVEDDAFIAFDLQRCLLSGGYAVVGPFPSVDAGMRAIEREQVDVAVLDVNLAGTLVYPLADMLSDRGVPFLFVTGYAASDLPPRFRDRPICRKPCLPEQMLAMVTALRATLPDLADVGDSAECAPGRPGR